MPSKLLISLRTRPRTSQSFRPTVRAGQLDAHTLSSRFTEHAVHRSRRESFPRLSNECCAHAHERVLPAPFPLSTPYKVGVSNLSNAVLCPDSCWPRAAATAADCGRFQLLEQARGGTSTTSRRSANKKRDHGEHHGGLDTNPYTVHRDAKGRIGGKGREGAA